MNREISIYLPPVYNLYYFRKCPDTIRMHHALMFTSIAENSTKEDTEERVRSTGGKNTMRFICGLQELKPSWSQHDLINSLHNSENYVSVINFMSTLDTVFCI